MNHDEFITTKAKTRSVQVGSIVIGGDAQITVQSMTDTITSNVKDTVAQIKLLVDSGAEIVRITVDNSNAATAVSAIKDSLMREEAYAKIPLVGCFHYNGHILLQESHECALALDKYRINPGNVGTKGKRDKNFEEILKIAQKFNKPIRIGVNGGSLEQELLSELIEENTHNNLSIEQIKREAIVKSALLSAQKAVSYGMQEDKIILSAKVSNLSDVVWVYKQLSKHSQYPLHVGLTEAGSGIDGIVKTAATVGILLHHGIGNTIRVSTTSHDRTEEVKIAKSILQALNIRNFAPSITSCPGCGRTSSTAFQTLNLKVNEYVADKLEEWKKLYGDEKISKLKIAVMGCIVNGPGESKSADIGISMPGNNEEDLAVVFIKGTKKSILRKTENTSIYQQFITILEDFIASSY
ncbi:flavodoxin-dependent (E)-4-hydroxy-3-methylbut-2-enyl-diphosphate synthase [Candidatus Fokinia crypta]|uniref:4-hydroxy-3-methylbut-2-en-1-yl diphosphate synthase (flavodoxin) n=1 Tax=Candidatus Fokinia crypta TaxID=1920990 RepID=A0ABZ0UN84_9RICK|nr:flavodoxin-dependent (E)-4-hydroxy-3-methylbut-2-enyl-diphosphate synthase [Candidatus Fokinia cryptica]WPX97584.1 4-hydroxy-3-methylbut-2-en-1-yl diphosphate synthase [Candidatus Fokinia cryptica]